MLVYHPLRGCLRVSHIVQALFMSSLCLFVGHGPYNIYLFLEHGDHASLAGQPHQVDDLLLGEPSEEKQRKNSATVQKRSESENENHLQA